MITNEEQQRIRQEEIFRAEVQRQIKPAESHTFLARLWRFGNSSFGLWILSAVVLSLLTSGYAKWQANAAADLKRKEDNNKVIVQCYIRFKYAAMLFSQADSDTTKTDPNFVATKREDYLEAIAGALDDTVETRLGPEFKDRSTLSFILESMTGKWDPAKKLPDAPEFSVDLLQLMKLRKKLASSNWTKLSSEEQKNVFASIDEKRRLIDAFSVQLLSALK